MINAILDFGVFKSIGAVAIIGLLIYTFLPKKGGSSDGSTSQKSSQSSSTKQE